MAHGKAGFFLRRSKIVDKTQVDFTWIRKIVQVFWKGAAAQKLQIRNTQATVYGINIPCTRRFFFYRKRFPHCLPSNEGQ